MCPVPCPWSALMPQVPPRVSPAMPALLPDSASSGRTSWCCMNGESTSLKAWGADFLLPPHALPSVVVHPRTALTAKVERLWCGGAACSYPTWQAVLFSNDSTWRPRQKDRCVFLFFFFCPCSFIHPSVPSFVHFVWGMCMCVPLWCWKCRYLWVLGTQQAPCKISKCSQLLRASSPPP